MPAAGMGVSVAAGAGVTLAAGEMSTPGAQCLAQGSHVGGAWHRRTTPGGAWLEAELLLAGMQQAAGAAPSPGP